MGSWVRIDGTLPRHRKTVDLRARIGEMQVEAYLQRLWLWCYDNADDGLIRGLDQAGMIEAAADWRGDAGKLANALIESGFVDRAPDGQLSIHDWEEHNGKYIKKAKKDAARVRKTREKFKKDAEREYAKRRRTVREQPLDVCGNETRRDETKRKNKKQKRQQQQPARATELPPDGLSGATDVATAEELRALWNAAHRSLDRYLEFPEWVELTPDQVAPAAALWRSMSVPRWEQFFAIARRSNFLNGGGELGWVFSPQKLLEKGTPFVVAVCNGEYRNAKDIPAPRGAA